MEIIMEFDLLAGEALSHVPICKFELRKAQPNVRRPYNLTLAEELAQLIRFRRKREAMFGSELFMDPVWDMLLDLCLSSELNRRVSVSGLCIASASPATTGLRWITAMEKRGMITREADPRDKRRFFISLTPEVALKLRKLLCERFDIAADPSTGRPSFNGII
jgi:hypothetical protein